MSDKLSDNYSQAKKSSDSFRTPPELFNALNEVTPFFWDACCTKDNCLIYWDQSKKLNQFDCPACCGYHSLCYCCIIKDYNYLTCDLSFYESRPYRENIFINPPYSRGSVGPIIKKAWEDAKHFRIVMLLKADMSTDWFNILIDYPGQQPTHRNQFKEWGLKRDYETLLRTMKEDTSRVGILHLRKRVKFLADEEMMKADSKNGIGLKYNIYRDLSLNQSIGNPGITKTELLETKNFKRGADGLIYPKSTGTFPSMLVILDRRGEK